MYELSSDPVFYVVTGIAVLITSVAKGGFGGIAMLSVPLMSLVVSPILAAAITLPLLLIMDAFSVYIWRRDAAWNHFWALIPGAILGIGVGAASAKYVSEDLIRLIVGVISVSFFIYYYWPKSKTDADTRANRRTGFFWGSFAGFTSYIAHAGSTPYHVYIIPKQLPKQAFAATAAWFFAAVNLIKLPAFIATGQLNMVVFYQALLFVPLVPVGVYLGYWLNSRVNHIWFYRIILGSILLIGLKLIYDGLA